MNNTVIFDVDTQRDFLCLDSKICDEYVSAVTNIENILAEALRNEIVVLGSVFAYPEVYSSKYCVIDTEGQEKINETMMVDTEFYYNVPTTNHGIDLNLSGECWQIVFEKLISDVWDPTLGQPDNLNTFLRTETVNNVIIVGNNVDDGMIETIEGFVDSQYNVTIVTDAMCNWDHNVHRNVLISMGVTLLDTSEVINEIKRGAYVTEDIDS